MSLMEISRIGKVRYLGTSSPYSTTTIVDDYAAKGKEITLQSNEVMNLYQICMPNGKDQWLGMKPFGFILGMKPQLANNSDYIMLTIEDYDSYIKQGVLERLIVD